MSITGQMREKLTRQFVFYNNKKAEEKNLKSKRENSCVIDNENYSLMGENFCSYCKIKYIPLMI